MVTLLPMKDVGRRRCLFFLILVDPAQKKEKHVSNSEGKMSGGDRVGICRRVVQLLVSNRQFQKCGRGCDRSPQSKFAVRPQSAVGCASGAWAASNSTFFFFLVKIGFCDGLL